MKSLPNDFTYHLTKKAFEQCMEQKRNHSENYEEIQPPPSNLMKISTSSINYHKTLTKRKQSNIVDWLIISQRTKTFYLFFFNKIILPNIMAFLIIFGIMKFENDLGIDCAKSGEEPIIYITARDILIGDFLYIWAVNLCLFDEKLTNKYIKCLTLLGSLIICFLIKYFKIIQINDKKIYFDVYFFPLLFQMVLFSIYTKSKKNIERKEWTKIFLTFVFLIMSALDLIILRRFIIQEIYYFFAEAKYQKIIFQCILFLLYQIYGKIML